MNNADKMEASCSTESRFASLLRITFSAALVELISWLDNNAVDLQAPTFNILLEWREIEVCAVRK